MSFVPKWEKQERERERPQSWAVVNRVIKFWIPYNKRKFSNG
jgi:hypothetical protein